MPPSAGGLPGAGNCCLPPVKKKENSIHALAIGLPDLERDAVGDAVLLQEEHRVAQVALLRHESGDLAGLSLADPLHFRQPLGLLVHDPQRLVAEHLNDPCRQSLSNALNRAGRQIAQHSLRVLRRDHAIGVHLELLAVDGVLDDFAGYKAALALADGRRKAGAGKDPVLTVHLKHGICILFIPVDDMFYISLDFLHTVICLCAPYPSQASCGCNSPCRRNGSSPLPPACRLRPLCRRRRRPRGPYR